MYTTPIVYIDDVDLTTDYTEDGVGNVFSFFFLQSAKKMQNSFYDNIAVVYLQIVK